MIASASINDIVLYKRHCFTKTQILPKSKSLEYHLLAKNYALIGSFAAGYKVTCFYLILRIYDGTCFKSDSFLAREKWQKKKKLCTLAAKPMW